MRKILIINFGRMGDLLQTSPLIAYLKERNPNAKIALLAASGFQEVIIGIPGVDNPRPLELIGYMRALKAKSPAENFHLFESLLSDLKAEGYDVVFNLTHNRLGSALSFLLSAETIGMTLDNQGLALVNDPWMRLFLNSNINRGLNQFNLVDLYKLSAGFVAEHGTEANRRLHFTVNPSARTWADANLKDLAYKPLVGIQVGASTAAKRWPTMEFHSLAKLLSPDYHFLFFGSNGEIPLVEEASHDIQARNFAGKTNVQQLSALLERCSLLISNDTGTQHLACAVGTPVLSVTLGPAYASETGPYGEGHLIVEPDCQCMPCNYKRPCFDYKCHSYIKPQLLEWLARALLEARPISEIPQDLSTGVRIYRTDFDDNGLWFLHPIVPGANELHHRVNLAYRQAWFALLTDNNNNKIEFANSIGKDIAKDITTILEKVRELALTAEQGEALAGKLIALASDEKQDYSQIKNAGNAVANIDRRLETIGESCSELRPLTLNFNLGKEALPDADLLKLSQSTAELYSHLGKGCRLFHNFMVSQQKHIRKVLAINPPYYVSGEILRAIARTGVRVETVNLDLNIKNNPTQVEKFCLRLMDKVKEFQPDLLFTVNHLGLDREGVLIKDLEQMKVSLAVYYVDSPFLIMDDPQKLLSDSSVLFCWDNYYVEKLRSWGFQCEYLPLATDPSLFYPRSSTNIPAEYRVKIAYAAHSLSDAIEKQRQELTDKMLSENTRENLKTLRQNNGNILPEILEKVCTEFVFDSPEQRQFFNTYWILKLHQEERLEVLRALYGLNLTIFGDQEWGSFAEALQADFRPSVRYSDQLPLLYSGMDIGFNATSLQMPHGVNQRVFDIPSAGGFILTDYRPALEEIFDLTRDIAVYHSPSQARELAEYFLAHPELKAKMVASAREKLLKHHTYEHRAQALLSRMENLYSMSAKVKASAGVRPELSALQKEFTQTFDAPNDMSIHHFGEKYLVIAPEKAAWIVTDKISLRSVELLSQGMTIGFAAAEIAQKYRLSPETALLKLRDVIEKMHLAHFRQSYTIQIVDIDANRRNLQLFLTRNCNLNCRHCYFSAGKALPNELPTPEWKRIIREFSLLGQGNAVTFTGGEPLSHPDFFSLAQFAVDNGLKVILLTNGGLIQDQAVAHGIADIADTVQVSLDGATAEVNDAIRGPGSFSRAIKAIKLLLAEKIEVEVTCVVLPENVADLEENLAEFVASFVSSRLRCALSVANPKGRLKGREIAEAESLVGRVLSACANADWMRRGNFHSGYGTFGCEIANSLVVNPEGKIGNCPYLNYSGPGKVTEGDFTKLTATDRAWHRQAIKESRKCLTCDLRNFQCGGCKIFGTCTEQLKLRNYYRMLSGN